MSRSKVRLQVALGCGWGCGVVWCGGVGRGGMGVGTDWLWRDHERTIQLFYQSQKRRLINDNTHSQTFKKCALSKFGYR